MSKAVSDFETLSEFKRYNEAQGFHFFDDDTMEGFRSRIETDLIADEYFITSEAKSFPHRLPNGGMSEDERGYTIRRACDDGSVDTVSEFNEFPCLEDARETLSELI